MGKIGKDRKKLLVIVTLISAIILAIPMIAIICSRQTIDQIAPGNYI